MAAQRVNIEPELGILWCLLSGMGAQGSNRAVEETETPGAWAGREIPALQPLPSVVGVRELNRKDSGRGRSSADWVPILIRATCCFCPISGCRSLFIT